MRRAYLVLGCLVFLALLVNTWVHYTHPAYSHYVETSRHIDERFEKMRKQMFDDIVPFVKFAVSHTNDLAGVSSSSNSVTSLIREKFLDFRFFSFNYQPFFEYQGHSYRLGDLFLGSPLVYISPTLIQTVTDRFIHSSMREKGASVQ